MENEKIINYNKQMQKRLPRPISDEKIYCGKKIKQSKTKFIWEFIFETNGKEEYHKISFITSKLSGKKVIYHNDKKIHDGPGQLIGWFNMKFSIDQENNFCTIKRHDKKDYSLFINDVEYSSLYTLYYVKLANELKKPISKDERVSLGYRLTRRNSDINNNEYKNRISAVRQSSQKDYKDDQFLSFLNQNDYDDMIRAPSV
ncbi:hypothetical protein PPERSA_12953 [Pseudocohnilembus persalinus]|uniref:Uncharacterized protein n=1 Tax=Pseudocohnilembus persalinus TaxID=266149 RepID=A0A0V0R2R4_PSEPJ|nr:hypothetical protein PPERSA_12953 [Pseudocohnilembus persalinus]|eukprot:KRX08472.1 hypothetical protein PPERSA_12953 [Pseudocohnilembus persalinus]